jgi:hypothetical protein
MVMDMKAAKVCFESRTSRAVLLLAGVVLFAGAAVAGIGARLPAVSVAGGPGGSNGSPQYRVLEPIASGDLTLFPVVRASGATQAADAFLTLDDGLRSGEVEVTEAGSAQGLVRSRGGRTARPQQRADEVNTLVLVNHSQKPLLLLAGEIVSGGKQDRIVATDRIVPAGSAPVDLSVFCIEHGRWTGSSDNFGAVAKSPAQSFMVQPEVRRRAMVARDQQQVWDSVSGAIGGMAMAAAPASAQSSANSTISVSSVSALPLQARSLGTTSYAKAMVMAAVSQKVDEASPELTRSQEQVMEQLRKENAVGVVVAVHGEIIWADIFADSGLLTRYWPKLVRSYAAEGLTDTSHHDRQATREQAERFLNAPMRGPEKSEGEVGVYRYLQAKTGSTGQFVLESLLPGLAEDVHVSRVKETVSEVVVERPPLMR